MQPVRDGSVVISGMGCVLPGSTGLEDWWQALESGKDLTSPFECARMRSETITRYGHISERQTQAGRDLVPRKQRRFALDSSLWGVSAAEQALRDAGLRAGDCPPERIGIFTASYDYLHPGIFSLIDGLKTASDRGALHDRPFLTECFMQRRGADPFTVIKSLDNNVLGMASISLGLRGDCGSFTGDAIAATAALNAAVAALGSASADVAVVIATGSYLNPNTLAHFIQQGRARGTVCRPFDQTADGLILADGACALVLERAERSAYRGQNSDICVRSIASTADVMSRGGAIFPTLMANLAGSPAADFIVADGIGVPEQDQQTAREIAGVLPDVRTTCVNGPTGVLGPARGLLSVVAASLALKNQNIPAMSALQKPISYDLNFIAGKSRSYACTGALVLNREQTNAVSGVLLEKLSPEY